MPEERKIRILFFIHDLGHGGAEKVLVNLVNNMDKSKFDITVMSLFGGGVNEKYLCDEVRYRVVFKRTIPGNSRLVKLLSPALLHKLFVKEVYDIEVGYLEGPAVRIISGCKTENTKLVAWEHSLPHTKEQFGGLYKGYEDSVQIYSSYDQVVCVSKSVKDGFCEVYPQLQEPAVLYNVIETDSIAEKAQEEAEDELFDDSEFKIVGVGKIQPLKGFDKLARVHRLLVEDGYPVHTYILGEGSQQAEIEEYLEENGLFDSFSFLGYKENPYKYMSKCDLYVCPSHTEGFSTAAIEALLVGLPIVTTPVSGMEEMLGADGKCGIITDGSEVELCAAIECLIENETLVAKMKGWARENGNRFSLDATVVAAEDFFVSLANCQPARSSDEERKS